MSDSTARWGHKLTFHVYLEGRPPDEETIWQMSDALENLAKADGANVDFVGVALEPVPTAPKD